MPSPPSITAAWTEARPSSGRWGVSARARSSRSRPTRTCTMRAMASTPRSYNDPCAPTAGAARDRDHVRAAGSDFLHAHLEPTLAQPAGDEVRDRRLSRRARDQRRVHRFDRNEPLDERHELLTHERILSQSVFLAEACCARRMSQLLSPSARSLQADRADEKRPNGVNMVSPVASVG